MKKYLLIIYTLAISPLCFAQNCFDVTGAIFTGSGSSWNLTVSYIANGNKSFQLIVRCGATVILNECSSVNGSGSTTFSGLNCVGGFDLLTATITQHTGNCNSASNCGPDLTVPPPSGGPLPVNMGAFYAKRKNSSVNLSWKTETEINAKEFILQRKVGNEFLDVATIVAHNSSTGSFYTFSDLNSYRGVSQYRLKIIDLNGSYSYSEIRAVKGIGAANDFTIFPNPSTGNAKITITDISEPTDVQLVDNSGRVLKTVSMNNSNTADFNNLQKGMYLIRIINKNSGESLTKKLNVIQ